MRGEPCLEVDDRRLGRTRKFKRHFLIRRPFINGFEVESNK